MAMQLQGVLIKDTESLKACRGEGGQDVFGALQVLVATLVSMAKVSGSRPRYEPRVAAKVCQSQIGLRGT